MNLILVGFKGCGETTLGKAAAHSAFCPFLDTDEALVRRYRWIHAKFADRITPKDIFVKHGEVYFRELEKQALSELKPQKPSIIATGGGTLLHPYNRFQVKNMGLVVYLSVPPEILFQRLLRKKDAPAAVNIKNEEAFRKEFVERQRYYLEIADKVVEAASTSALAEIVAIGKTLL